MKENICKMLVLALCSIVGNAVVAADDDYRKVTIIDNGTVLAAVAAAPVGEVSDQAIRHVSSAEGNLGIGVVHRPVIPPGRVVGAIQHHNQSEVYRVISGSGTLVTSTSLEERIPLAEKGDVVLNLTGPSDRGVIEDNYDSQVINAGDIVIIPAGVAHGFSEITEAITYMVVRIDPQRLVTLK